MENQHDKIIQRLDSNRPSLSETKKSDLWSAIAKETIDTAAVPSPYTWLTLFKKPLAPVAFILLLTIGATGLVAASEPTRPGDTLFAVKQATESIRLALASEDTKVRLEAEFAAERLLELSSLLEESLTESKKNNSNSSKIKIEDEKRVNESLGITLSYLGQSDLSSSTKDNLYGELASLLQGVPVRIDDKKLKSYKNDALVEIKVEEDNKRIEIEDGEKRIRIREKDGELRIDYKNTKDKEEERKDKNDDKRNSKTSENENQNRAILQLDFKNNEDEGEDESRFENSYQETNTRDEEFFIRDDDDVREEEEPELNYQDTKTKIEVRVENGKAEVKIDGENDSEFTIPYTTKSLLITTIALKTGLSEVAISNNLDLEFKD
jgi:hypothetical protein